MSEKNIPSIKSKLRHTLTVPTEIFKCSGIAINGKRIKSLVFTTDVAILRNINADAAIAVYPFTPQPAIIRALMLAAEMPVFCGVGGGTTRGQRVVDLAADAEFQGAIGVVVNSPTPNETILQMNEKIDIPIVITVVKTDLKKVAERIKAGAAIINVSGASNTPEIVYGIKKEFPDFPVIATGGPTADSILSTIEAGANAITYTPPIPALLFKDLMLKYREEL